VVCSTFLGSGWSVVRSALLAKGGTSKKRPLLHLHKIPTRSNKVIPETLQMVLGPCICQYTCITNPGKCHLSVTPLPASPILGTSLQHLKTGSIIKYRTDEALKL
jgi:hypothetical protein